MLKEIVRYDRTYDKDFGHVCLKDAIFLRDFGPFRKGEKIPELVVNFYNGSMAAFGNGDTRTCSFRMRVDSPMLELAELVREASA